MKKFKITKKNIWIPITLVVVVVIAIVAINANKAKQAASDAYQTQTIEKSDLTAIVGATGTVRANQSVTINWLTSGRIEEIKAAVDDEVKSGETLAVLAESSLPQSIILAQADLVSAQRQLENLKNSSSAMAQAQLNLANATEDYNKALWNKLSATGARETNADTINAARAAVTLAEDKVSKAEDRYDDFAETPDSDPLKAAALSGLSSARLELSRAKTQLNHYLGTADDYELAINDAEVAVAKAALEDAQREWDRLKNGADPDDIAAAEARVASIQSTIDMASVTSPINGTVTVSSGMINDLVNAGTSAFRVDDLSHLYVDVEIPEVDINRVKVGQEVTMTFDAISTGEYQGKVTKVAKVGNNSSGTVNFTVTIEVLNPDEQVLPGMTAAVNIIVSNVKDVLIVPNRAVRMLNGNRVVYIMKNSIPTPIEIEIGASSDTNSEVISGDIKVGDTLILNPSTDLTSFMTGFGR